LCLLISFPSIFHSLTDFIPLFIRPCALFWLGFGWWLICD
jgi:hypothetical protein